MPRPANPPDLSTFAGRLGASIRARRERAKLTVDEAASAASVPVPTWYNWESGRHVSLERLPEIAKALGCSVRLLVPEE